VSFPVPVSVVNIFMPLKHEDEHVLNKEFFTMKEVLPRNVDLRHCQSITQFWVLQHRADICEISYNLIAFLVLKRTLSSFYGRKSCGSFCSLTVFQFSMCVLQNDSRLNGWIANLD